MNKIGLEVCIKYIGNWVIANCKIINPNVQQQESVGGRKKDRFSLTLTTTVITIFNSG